MEMILSPEDLRVQIRVAQFRKIIAEMNVQRLAIDFDTSGLEVRDLEIYSNWIRLFLELGRLSHISQLHLSLSMDNRWGRDVFRRDLVSEINAMAPSATERSPPRSPPRAHHCPRALPSPLVVAVPDTKTYLLILLQTRMPVGAILQFLNDAYNVLTSHIRAAGDGVIAAGRWDLEVNGIGLSTVNTNNHQQTYGVLGAAVEGLSRFFYENQERGAGVYFYIFDGGVEVGQGSLGPV
ncbi:MAG: hypothetical protein FRX48_03501 [Lasallia pustulata]|uniref:Uncharacterized protein n=1 Tax=Lasallia pustulata TaxID=136370 RepID=A0A5M8PSG1_9LECA|nr:MAG: hypothetical protein FRX48_03501 [Lasallia pustulata]